MYMNGNVGIFNALAGWQVVRVANRSDKDSRPTLNNDLWEEIFNTYSK